METSTPLETFKGLVDWKYRGRDLYLARCPRCHEWEFRFFDTEPIEWRCASCHLEGFGVEEFIQKLRGSGFDLCRMCGKPFRVPAYIRRKKEYCGATCRKRAQRAHEVRRKMLAGEF